MTDRELLELAAKAVGYRICSIQNGKLNCYGLDGKHNFHWNPLADDGDALRLMVKLNMHVIIDGENNHVRVYARYWAKADVDYGACGFGDDPYAATRRAIVGAAAEIGKDMK